MSKNSFGIDPDKEEGDDYYNITSCDEAAAMWEEFELEECPICGAVEKNGEVRHLPPWKKSHQ